MGVKVCAHCSKQFQPKRSDAKFCSSKCRSAAGNAGHAPQAAPAQPTPVGAGVTASTAATLARLGKLDTPVGAGALVVASRLDFDMAATGASVAALQRELRATMAELNASAPAAADPLDELRKRREARRGA